MKIAVFHELPPGGARRAINEFSKDLKKNNIVDLFIVDESENINEEKFFTNTYFYKFLPKIWKGKDWKTRIYKDTIELVKLCSLNRKIAKEIDKNKYDIVLVSASKFIEAPFIMQFLKTPFVFYIHDPYYRIIYDPMLEVSRQLDFFRYNYEKLNRLIRKALDRSNVLKAKLCLCPSEFIANLFFKTYGKKCIVVPYGVDSTVFKEASVKKDIDMLYIGSHEPIDGYNLVGQSVEKMNFKPKVRSILLEKEWISDDKKLAKIYQRSKLLLATARNEGLGAVPLEAMACGVPVVATNEAGHKETVVDGRTGYLLPRDSQVFAKKLDWLFVHPKQMMQLGKNARRHITEKWDWNKRSQELLRVFTNYLDKIR